MNKKVDRKAVTACLLGLMGALSLSACGNSNREDKNQPFSNAISTAADVSEAGVKETELALEEKDISIEGFNREYVNRHYGFSMKMPGNANWQKEIDYGYYFLEYPGKEEGDYLQIYVTCYCPDVDERQKETIDISKYENSQDIFELFFEEIKEDFLKIKESKELLDYEVKTVKTENVNGVEMTKFEGKFQIEYSPGKWYAETRNETFQAYGIAGSKTPILIIENDSSKGGYLREEYNYLDLIISTYQDGN